MSITQILYDMGKESLDHCGGSFATMLLNSSIIDKAIIRTIQLNPMSSNNSYGWMHYVLAHLHVRCNIRLIDLAKALGDESADAEANLGYLSDNQCIMRGNRWYYTFRSNGYMIFSETQEVYPIQWDCVAKWIRQMR